MKKVSVVVPCKNEERQIATCVKSLLENGYNTDYLEILVVDGMSTDRTVEIVDQLAEEFPQVKLLENKKEKTPFALNIGIQNASGDYTLIASGHSSFDKGYIETLIVEMQRLGADVVGGNMITRLREETPTSVAIQKVLSNPLGVGNATFRTGVKQPKRVDTVPFGLYKTNLLKELGGYDERLIRNHDIELSKRLLARGAKIYLIPNARCYYFARSTWKQLAKNNAQNGKWNLLTVFITRDFSSLSVRHFVPLGFILSIVLPLIVGIFYLPFMLVSAGVLVLYIIAILINCLRMDRTNTTLIHLFITFFILHFAYGFGSLQGVTNFYKYFRSK